MKRAEVWRNDFGRWTFLTTHCPRDTSGDRMSETAWPDDMQDDGESLPNFPTHAAALAHALAAVGLAPEKENG